MVLEGMCNFVSKQFDDGFEVLNKSVDNVKKVNGSARMPYLRNQKFGNGGIFSCQ